MGIEPGAIDTDRPLAEFGVDSVRAVELIADLERRTGRELGPTFFIDHPTLAEAAAVCLRGDSELRGESAHPPRRSAATKPDGSRDAIAVVGLDCLFPGAEGPDALWALLLRGDVAVGTPPVEHAAGGSAANGVERPGLSSPGGYLSGIAGFDCGLFGISPREARRMDPQQRLLLKTVWRALEHAAISPAWLRGRDVGVFVGISSADYGVILRRRPEQLDRYAALGGAPSIAANRISYVFDWRGPSVSVDTACSSSLVALHMACAALRGEECEMAIASGVNLILDPVVSRSLEQTGVISADGACCPFSDRANGYVRSDGVGTVVLKRAADVRRDGDRVLAWIRGSAIACDGRTNGVLAPNQKAQEAMIWRALAEAGVEPQDIGYVEAHGTGTRLGDRVEALALGAVLGMGRPAGNPCLLGSLKSNLGHMEAAAGIGGLIKTVLALYHGRIPPSVNSSPPSEIIPFDELGLKVCAEVADCSRPRPFRAGVSSFGFGGTIAHAILESAAQPEPA